MPVHKCPNNKYRIGTGPCVFDTEEKAQKAYRGYLFKKHGAKASQMEGIDEPEHISLMEEAEQVQEIYEADQPGLATQAVLFSKDHYPSLARARAKAKSMGYKTSEVDKGGESAKYWRFRQKDPDTFVKRTGRPPFVMKDIAPGIRLVLGIPKK